MVNQKKNLVGRKEPSYVHAVSRGVHLCFSASSFLLIKLWFMSMESSKSNPSLLAVIAHSCFFILFFLFLYDLSKKGHIERKKNILRFAVSRFISFRLFWTFFFEGEEEKERAVNSLKTLKRCPWQSIYVCTQVSKLFSAALIELLLGVTRWWTVFALYTFLPLKFRSHLRCFKICSAPLQTNLFVNVTVRRCQG